MRLNIFIIITYSYYIINMKPKVCSSCEKIFDENSGEMVPYRSKCKACYRKDQKRRYDLNKDKIKQKRLEKIASGDKYVKSSKKIRNENKEKVLKAEVERLTNILNNMIASTEAVSPSVPAVSS